MAGLSAAPKVCSVEEAVARHVGPGDRLHLASTGTRPNALLRALGARFAGTRPGFTVSATSIGGTQVSLALVHSGLFARIVCGYLGHQYPSPKPASMVAALARDGVEVEEWTLLSLVQRLRAGAMGMRWAITSSLADGSLHAASGRVRHVDVDDDTLTLLPALRPDVTFVHAAIADQYGNAIICPPYTENTLGALAARRGALVTVERIVSDEEFRRHSHLPVIPALAVLAVSEAPLGSHPAALFADGIDPGLTYADDYAYLSEMLSALEEDDDTRHRWIEKNVLTKADPVAHQRSLPAGRVEHLRTWWRKDAGGGSARTGPAVPAGPANPTERMVVLAARALLSATRSARPEYLFAGIGTSSLAAWLANELGDEGFPLLVSETGLLGYQPSVGDPWLFSVANIESATGLTDTESILGALIQGRGDKGMSVLAAAQVDAAGDINSTRAGGRFLTGSGGANDVLSGGSDATVLIPHRPRRLVAEVDYVTSPGRAVQRIVTDRAVLTRAVDGRFMLSTVLADPAHVNPDELVADVVAATPWPCLGEHRPEIAPPPGDHELRVLRGLDPLGLFLDHRPAHRIEQAPATGQVIRP